jgi:hypothetical protein
VPINSTPVLTTGKKNSLSRDNSIYGGGVQKYITQLCERPERIRLTIRFVLQKLEKIPKKNDFPFPMPVARAISPVSHKVPMQRANNPGRILSLFTGVPTN